MATLSEVFTDIGNAIRTCNNNDVKYGIILLKLWGILYNLNNIQCSSVP